MINKQNIFNLFTIIIIFILIFKLYKKKSKENFGNDFTDDEKNKIKELLNLPKIFELQNTLKKITDNIDESGEVDLGNTTLKITNLNQSQGNFAYSNNYYSKDKLDPIINKIKQILPQIQLPSQ